MIPWKFKITCSRPVWYVFCWKTFQLVTFPLVFCCRSCRSVPRFHSPRAVLAVDDRSKWSPWSHPRSSGREKNGCFFLRQKKKTSCTPCFWKVQFLKRSDLAWWFCWVFEARFSSKWLEEIVVPSIHVSLVKKSLAASCDAIQLYLSKIASCSQFHDGFCSANPSASCNFIKMKG